MLIFYYKIIWTLSYLFGFAIDIFAITFADRCSDQGQRSHFSLRIFSWIWYSFISRSVPHGKIQLYKLKYIWFAKNFRLLVLNRFPGDRGSYFCSNHSILGQHLKNVCQCHNYCTILYLFLLVVCWLWSGANLYSRNHRYHSRNGAL